MTARIIYNILKEVTPDLEELKVIDAQPVIETKKVSHWSTYISINDAKSDMLVPLYMSHDPRPGAIHISIKKIKNSKTHNIRYMFVPKFDSNTMMIRFDGNPRNIDDGTIDALTNMHRGIDTPTNIQHAVDAHASVAGVPQERFITELSGAVGSALSKMGCIYYYDIERDGSLIMSVNPYTDGKNATEETIKMLEKLCDDPSKWINIRTPVETFEDAIALESLDAVYFRKTEPLIVEQIVAYLKSKDGIVVAYGDMTCAVSRNEVPESATGKPTHHFRMM